MATITFDLLADGVQIECRVYQDASEEIGENTILGAWQDSQYCDCHLLDGNIAAALEGNEGDNLEPASDSPAVTEPSEDAADASAEQGKDNCVLRFLIGEQRPSVASVEISADRMSAVLSIVAPEGGAYLEVDDVLDVLTNNDVIFGIDHFAIVELLEQAQTKPPGTKVNAPVAKGTSPGPGVGCEFKSLVTPIQERVLIPQERDDGTLDMRELGDIESVSKGDVLIERIPAASGDSGHDVTGAEIVSEPPKNKPFDVGEGTEISTENDNLLIAARDGIAHSRGSRGMSVDDVLLVQDVDLRVGNVHYEGSVYVRGDVMNRMALEASGDILVNGFLEAAKVRCGGDLIVKNGIIGKPRPADAQTAEGAPGCQVYAKNITAKYAQYADLRADNQISISSHLTHCVSHCRRMHVGFQGQRRAKLLGGQTHASLSVEVGAAGSEALSQTVICLDRGVESLPDEVQAAERLLKQKTELLLKLTETAKAQQKVPPAQRDNDAFVRTIKTLKALRNEVDELGNNAKRKRAELERHRATARFISNDRVYPGVELRCFDALYQFKGETPASVHGVDDSGWIVLK